jgi:hypothetical protein
LLEKSKLYMHTKVNRIRPLVSKSKSGVLDLLAWWSKIIDNIRATGFILSIVWCIKSVRANLPSLCELVSGAKLRDFFPFFSLVGGGLPLAFNSVAGLVFGLNTYHYTSVTK